MNSGFDIFPFELATGIACPRRFSTALSSRKESDSREIFWLLAKETWQKVRAHIHTLRGKKSHKSAYVLASSGSTRCREANKPRTSGSQSPRYWQFRPGFYPGRLDIEARCLNKRRNCRMTFIPESCVLVFTGTGRTGPSS